MARLKKMSLILLCSAFIAGSVFITGCNGGITKEQWDELQSLKAQVQSLENEKATKEAEKKKIEQQIKQKDDQLNKLQKDIETLKNCK